MSVTSRFRAALIPIALAFVSIPTSVRAAPHSGDIERMEQPDGTPVDVRLYGDEFYVRVEGLDGYTLVRDPRTKIICYAALNADSSDWVSTGVRYSATENGAVTAPSFAGDIHPGLDLKRSARAAKRAAAARGLGLENELDGGSIAGALAKAAADTVAPDSVKRVVGLVVLVDFPDVPWNIPRAAIDSLVNVPGYAKNGNNGSVRDYWLSVSHGKFEYRLVVTEYYRARNNKSYYDRAGGYAGGIELVGEAMQGLYAKGFDFSTITRGSSGVLKAVNLMYAGAAGTTWGQGIWPHRGNIQTLTLGNVKMSGYMMTSVGNAPTIGTFCHESGHLLFGWPDLYDYDSDSRGDGGFDLMSSQNYKNPQPTNPWFRAGQGWEPLIDLRRATNGFVQVPSNGRADYLFANPGNTKEAFVIENVEKKGRWAALPDFGLLVWHVDDGGNNSWQDRTFEKHYRVSVVQADGKFDLEHNANNGGTNDLFRAGVNTALSATTVPDDKWWNGGVSGLDIFNISAIQDIMTFQLRGVPVAGVAERSPSPASVGFTVAGRRARLFLERPGNVRVTALSADGRARLLAQGPMAAGPRDLDLAGLPAGAYTLRAEGAGVRAALPVVLAGAMP